MELLEYLLEVGDGADVAFEGRHEAALHEHQCSLYFINLVHLVQGEDLQLTLTLQRSNSTFFLIFLNVGPCSRW